MKVSSKVSNSIANAETAKSSKSSKTDIADALSDAKLGKLGGGPAGSSRVDVSMRAQEMAKAKELASPSNDIDEAKISRLQKLIDEGKYKVDADALADRILDEHTKMS
jgi:negative regulator of flagellin synthesis FlgM